MEFSSKIKVMDMFGKKDWLDFNTLPLYDDSEFLMDLPPMDDLLRVYMEQIESTGSSKKVHRTLKDLATLITERLEEGEYDTYQTEGIFRFACQVACYNGVFVNEIFKRSEIENLFCQIYQDLGSFFESFSPEDKIGELRIVLDAVVKREKVVQRFAAGVYDFRTEYVFVAKLLRDPRLKGYLLNAFNFYRNVPSEELLYDRETDLENVIEAMGNAGWDEFVPLIEPLLYSDDEIIPFVVAGALADIGGERAVAALKKFRYYCMEDFLIIDSFNLSSLDVNIAFAQGGYQRAINFVSGRSVSHYELRSAVRTLAGIREAAVVKFLYNILTDDSYNLLRDTVDEVENLTLVDEVMMALDLYPEKYVIGIIGEKYRIKRDYLFHPEKFMESGIQDGYDD